MLTKKEVQNFRNRINRAKTSFSILNSRKPLSYPYLDKKIIDVSLKPIEK